MSFPHARPATQADVARAAGVSRSLVSLALADSPKVAPASRERIRRIAAELGYRVNLSASSLASHRPAIVGLVLPNLRNAFFERLTLFLREAALAHRLTLFVVVGAERRVELDHSIESLLGVRVAGLVLVSPWLPDADLQTIGEEVPTCVIGRPAPGGQVDSVQIDELAAATLAAEHLAAQGMETLAYIGPSAHEDASRHEREEALRRAAELAGMAWTARECSDAGPAVRALLDERDEPVGLVIHNDIMAIDAVPVLHRRGRRVGREVALASYDDTFLARREEFSLTSIHQPEEDMARHALRMLTERAGLGQERYAGAGRHLLLEPALSVRASSSPTI